MSVSEGFRTYVVEQLAAVPGLSTRRMFGGVGLYSDALFFALIDDDVLFFKVDDANRDDYVSRGMKAFMPIPGQAASFGYYQVPADVLEDAEELARWARRSIEVAQRAAQKRVRLKPDPQKKRVGLKPDLQQKRRVGVKPDPRKKRRAAPRKK